MARTSLGTARTSLGTVRTSAVADGTSLRTARYERCGSRHELRDRQDEPQNRHACLVLRTELCHLGTTRHLLFAPAQLLGCLLATPVASISLWWSARQVLAYVLTKSILVVGDQRWACRGPGDRESSWWTNSPSRPGTPRCMTSRWSRSGTLMARPRLRPGVGPRARSSFGHDRPRTRRARRGPGSLPSRLSRPGTPCGPGSSRGATEGTMHGPGLESPSGQEVHASWVSNGRTRP
jgi:hypothetical protein